MMRDVPGNAAYFACYEFSKRLFSRIEGSESASLPAIFIAGGLAGVANWIVAIPFDVVKSRYQTAPSGKYRNLPDVVRTLLREEGAGAFFRGLSPALLRAFPANAACLAGVETARSLIGNSQQHVHIYV
jgi:solute carrier family 25 carnitine/acylcarnitine transporter 20/29